MNCFACFSSKKPKEAGTSSSTEREHLAGDPSKENTKQVNLTYFTYQELDTATQNFRQQNILGQGSFGKVYRGTIPNSNKIVAVKQLDLHGSQGNREFIAEFMVLSICKHPNLVHLIGYCCEEEGTLLVYEYMPLSSLNKHLFGTSPDRALLSWDQRMKIALDVAAGLEYLHEKEIPPIIHRDLKSSNILLDDNYNAKISDFGLAKFGPTGNKVPAIAPVMGTDGYIAPEYRSDAKLLNTKIDVYSYGVLMLELITGRRAVDNSRPAEDRRLVNWADPILNDKRRYKELVDPRLGEQYPEKSLNQAVGIIVKCLQEDQASRPLMSDVVMALNHVATPDEETGASKQGKPLLIEERRSEAPIHDDVKGKAVVAQTDVKGKGKAVDE